MLRGGDDLVRGNDSLDGHDRPACRAREQEVDVPEMIARPSELDVAVIVGAWSSSAVRSSSPTYTSPLREHARHPQAMNHPTVRLLRFVCEQHP